MEGGVQENMGMSGVVTKGCSERALWGCEECCSVFAYRHGLQLGGEEFRSY